MLLPTTSNDNCCSVRLSPPIILAVAPVASASARFDVHFANVLMLILVHCPLKSHRERKCWVVEVNPAGVALIRSGSYHESTMPVRRTDHNEKSLTDTCR